MGIFTLPAVFSSRKKIVPAGLIIPYNGTSAPSGWSLFTDADGRFIIGAGNTYAVGATGGNTSLTTGGSSAAGSHTGGSFLAGYWNPPYNIGHSAAGTHNHTLTYNYTPPYYGLRLIKANIDLTILPKNAIIFSDISLNNLSRFSSGDGKLFSARSTIGSGGSNTIVGFNSSTSGSHIHNDGEGGGSSGSSSGYDNTTAGAHNHPNESFEITPNLYRVLLSAWTNASSAFRLQPGMYAFWESIVNIPDGWLLCDGSNGTLDLRNYFIEFADEDIDGTRNGNGKLSVPTITLSSITNNHSHAGSSRISSSSCRHPSYNNTHSHTINASTPTFLPPYYALAIIKLAA